MGDPLAWGSGEGLTNPHRKKRINLLKYYKLFRTWT